MVESNLERAFRPLRLICAARARGAQVLSVVASTANLDLHAQEHASLCATSKGKNEAALLALPGAQVLPTP